MKIIRLEANQFEPFTRKVKRLIIRRLLGKPKHNTDLTDQQTTFWGHPEDKQHAWCLN